MHRRNKPLRIVPRLAVCFTTLLAAVNAVRPAHAEETPKAVLVSTEIENDISESDLEMSEEELEEETYYDSLELLALCVEAEAGNQSLIGKRMVVDVILNRVDDPEWPDNIVDVIADPYEFSSYWDGGIDRVWEPSEETFLAVQMELSERSWPEIYYFTAGRYSEYGTPLMKVGAHYFSTK